MRKVLIRVSSFAAAAGAALGIFALCNAAPSSEPQPPRSEHHATAPDFVLAAMNPQAGDDSLAADAAAAGETGRVGRAAPRSYQPAPEPAPPREEGGPRALGPDDPIGQLILPPPGPQASLQPYDEPFDDGAPDRPVRPHAARPAAPRQAEPPPAPALKAPRPAIHHRLHHRASPRAPEVQARAAPPPEAAAKTPSAPAPEPVRPHRLHIVIAPPHRLALQAPPGTAAVNPALPEVEAVPPPEPAPVDIDTALARLGRSAAADMRAARFELSPALSGGRDGAAVVTLPSGLLSQLQADAEDSGLELDGPISVTVSLSGQGYGIVPEGAQTSRAEAGRPATFTWGVSPRGSAGGMMSAIMTAVLQVQGETLSVPLGVLTAEVPPPPQTEAPPVSTPAPAAAASAPTPAPDLSTRMRADLGKLGVRLPSRLNPRALAIPGHPTVEVPMIGPVPSWKVVSIGLILLALLFVQSLLRGAGARRDRRRRVAEIEDTYFSQGRA